MGSFSEVVIGFQFAADVPIEVLGLFAEWERPTGERTLAVIEPEERPGDPDPYEAVSYADDDPTRIPAWFDWFDGATPGQRAAAIRWVLQTDTPGAVPSRVDLRRNDYGNRWTLDVRSFFKGGPEMFVLCILPWARWIDPGVAGYRPLLGYARHENDEPPLLLWRGTADEGIVVSDLRPPSYRLVEDWAAFRYLPEQRPNFT